MSDDARTLLRRRSVGFVFQAFHVLPYLTVDAERRAAARAPRGRGARAQRAHRRHAGGRRTRGRGAPLSRASCPAARCSASRSRAHSCTGRAGARRRAHRQPRSAHRRTDPCAACASRSRLTPAPAILITHSRAAAETADRILRARRHGTLALHARLSAPDPGRGALSLVAHAAALAVARAAGPARGHGARRSPSVSRSAPPCIS